MLIFQQEKITELTKQLNEANSEISKYKKEYDSALIQVSTLGECYKELENKLEKLQNVLSQLELEKMLNEEKLNEKCYELTEENTNLGDKNNQLSKELDEANSEILKFNEECDFNLNKMSKLEEYCQELTNKSEDLKSIISQLELEKMQNELKLKEEMEVNQILCKIYIFI